MLPKIALATCRDYPRLDDDDRFLPPAFRAAGFQVEPVIWEDDRVDWKGFQSVILRSVWDYHEKIDPFRSWLARLQQAGAIVWNPIAVVLDNLHKTYLRDLERRGIAIVPTRWITASEPFDLAREMKALGWREAILKPAVSAGSRNTFRFTLAEAPRFQGTLESLSRQGTSMLQPFLPEILSEGEWSFLFFARELSHTVLKRPADGDFRVQLSYGGNYQTQTNPPKEAVALARAVLDCIDETLLYARVDLVRHAGRWLLAELEITEPSLYLSYDPAGADRLVQAYRRLMGI